MKKYTFSVHGISPDTDTVTAYVDVKYSMLPLMSLFSLQVTMDRKPDCSIDYYESQAIKQAQAVIADVVAETNAVNAGMVIGAETKDSHTNTHVGFSVQQFTLYNSVSGKMDLFMYMKDGQIFMNEAFINKA